MASLRKRIYSSGNYAWVIEYRIGKKSKMKTLGPIDKRTAEQLFHKFCAELAKNNNGIKEIVKITLKELKDEHLSYANAEKAQKTVEREEQVITNFINYFGNVPLDSLNFNDLDDYRLHRLKFVSESTVNLEFRHLKAIFNRAKKRGYLVNNIFEDIKPLRVPESDLPKFLELDEIEKVREAFKGDEFEYLVEFYLLTGARLQEALRLTWNDIDIKRKQIIIRSVHTKGKKHRIIPFSGDKALESLLKKLPIREDNLLFGPVNGGPQWKKRWISRKVSRVLNRCGFEWASCHTFRHTYISHLVMAGVPLTTVQQIVGHSDFKTTLKYAHLAPKHKIEMSAKRPY